MECLNLIDVFDREAEILEVCGDDMIYALDCKNEIKDLCTIGCYHAASGKKKELLTLDYTRIYESFQTYSQHSEFFYAVNVLQDYRVRLRKINKRTWHIDEDMVVNAMGEILSIYILDENSLLIIDEVKRTETLLSEYHMEDTKEAYVNLCYLYDIYTGRRYPVKDSRFHGLLDTFKLCDTPKGRRLIFQPVISEKQRESDGQPCSGLYDADLKAFAEAVKDGQEELPLKAVGEDGRQTRYQFVEAAGSAIYYLVQNMSEHTEAAVRFDTASGENSVIAQYPYKNTGRYFYDLPAGHVFYCEDYFEEKAVKNVACLTEPMLSFTFDGTYGDFSGIFSENVFVTVFYKKVLVREEYEYHEFAALHDRLTGSVSVFEARCEKHQDKLILMKTFLAL